jgi:N-acetylglucosamine-6-sulfatase
MLTRRRVLGSLASAPLLHGLEPPVRPNFVFILMDDLRWDELRCGGNPLAETPNIDRVAREGAQFSNAFVTTPLCSPSRASYLTGLYAHAHGIADNTARDAQSHQLRTFPRTLHTAGYETGFVGKFHLGNDDTPRPGFDYWVSFPGQGTYHNPDLNVDGKMEHTTGYTTDILSQRALAFLQRPHSRPFFLWLAHKAVHPELTQYADGTVSDPNGGQFIPPERYKSLYAGQAVPRRPNAMRAPEGKPALERKIPGMPPLGPATGTDDETIRNRLRMVKAVDDGVGDMLRVLEKSGQLDRTVFIFTSDEGYFFGEHGLSYERRLAYEESIKIPLLVRYPKLVRPGTRSGGFALNIDIAPTVLELAGVKPEWAMHGRSLEPLLGGEAADWRKSFIIEYFSDKTMPRISHMGYQAVRTERWKYIHYTELEGMDELYDLDKDPFEMHNVIRGDAKALRAVQGELQRLLSASPRPD